MIVAIAMVRDEADIIRETIGHMVGQVDHVIVADNGSVDGTRPILDTLGVEVVEDSDPAYYQSQKMTQLAMRALELGADWVVPFDADEVHRSTDEHWTIADRLNGLPPEVLISEAKLLDHVATPADAGQPPVARMPYRRAACVPLRKIAARARPDLTIEQGNHGARFEFSPVAPMVTDHIEVRHFPYRSAEQMIRKARNGAEAYAATNLPESVGKHWRDYGRLSDEQLAEVFQTYFFSADPEGEGLVYAPALG